MFVSITGDLFLSENDNAQWRTLASNVTAGEINRRRVMCVANYIVPGHGTGFAVTNAMRQSVQC